MISEFPLFLFTLLGGAAAGAYVLAAFFPESKATGKRLAAFPLVVLVLLAVSGLALLTHLGHPEHMLNAFSNPTAGITQEGIAMMLFGVCALVDLIFVFAKGAVSKGVRIAAAVFGFLLLCSMGNAYFQMFGKPVAYTGAVIPYMVVGGLGLGAALYALFMQEPYKKGAYLWTSVVIDALLAMSLVAMAVHFGEVSQAPNAQVCGLIVAPVASVATMLAAGKTGQAWVAPTVLGLMLVGMAISRYAFYALV